MALGLSTVARADEAEKERGVPETTDAPALPQEVPAPVPDDAKQPKLVKQIGLDFKNLFTTKENLWIVSAGAGAALLARPVDNPIAHSGFNSETSDGSGLDPVFDPGGVAGGGLFQVGTAVATFAVGKVSSDPGIESLGRDLVRAQIVTQSLTTALKYTVSRTRPDGSSTLSFPSGHTSGAFATATVLERHYGWKVGVPAYLFAGYVGASRINENKHYLSDVIFGATLGILGGRTVTLGLGDKRFSLSPMIVPGGAGVQLTLLH
jgi:membrane-associated phospholipid phosphatase